MVFETYFQYGFREAQILLAHDPIEGLGQGIPEECRPVQGEAAPEDALANRRGQPLPMPD